jgi:riboflavin transporter FmnP
VPITVGSVEVDIYPSTSGIYERLRDALVPAATRAGEDAGTAAGRAIGQRIATQVGSSVADGLRAGGQRSRPAAGRAGDEAGGAFGRLFRARVEAAFRSLPRANVGADATGFNAEMDRVRARLEALSNRRIGIDVSAADAMAELDRIQARLVALGSGHTDVNIRMDTARAIAQLDEFRAEVARADGQTVNVNADADTSRAVSSFGNLVTAAAAFGPAIIPILPIVAAGLGTVAAAGIAAAVGIGGIAAVAIPAFHSITGALQLQKAAQTASNASTSKGASTALQMAGAQQALATAERNAAQQIAQAQRQVAQAKRAVADAVQQAALSQQQADRAVSAAEKQLAADQVSAKQAQLDLTAARRTAAEQLVDLNNQLVDAQLSQERAIMAVAAAQKKLDADRQAGVGSAQLADDVLSLKEAKQALVEQGIQTKRLKEQAAAANKAGVEGSSTYKQAQDALTQAQQKVADQTQALKDAQADQARTEVANARSIADAQAKVADAERNVAQAQASAADSITSAQRQIAQVQQQAAASASAAGQAQAKYQQALANMSPATRATYDAFLRLRGAFTAWSTSLQPQVMPIFTRALSGIARVLPGLTPFVLAAARALGGLEDKLGREVKAPWARSLRNDLSKTVGPAITGIGVAVGNIFKGVAGIIDAFLPHVNKAGKTVDGWTAKFARWGTSLKGSPEFEGFIDYVKQQAPIVGRAIKNVFDALFRVIQAFAPISGISLGLLSGIASVIKLIPLPVLKGLALGFVALALGLKAAALAQGLLNTAMELNPIGAVVAAVVALVLIFVYAWQNSQTFRDIVTGVWLAILGTVQSVVGWFKNTLLPFFTKTIPAAFKWLLSWVKANWPLLLGILTGPFGLATWAILHYWSQISSGLSTGWTWIKTHVLYPIRDFFIKTIPGWATSLSSSVVTAFKNMGSGVATAWGKLEKAAKDPINFVISTVWNKGILGVWNKITGWIPGLPKMGKLPLLAQGGTLPVQPGVFNKPTAIVGEGNPAHPEYVIPTDPKYRGRALGLLQQAGAQMLAGGGIIGTIGNVASGVGGAVAGAAQGAWKGIKTAADFLADPVGNLLKLLNPITNKLKPLKSPWGKVAAGLPLAAINGLKKLVTSFGGKTGGAGDTGTHGTGAAAAQEIARTLLRAFNWAPNQMSPLIKLWNGESGWNYKATNASSGAYGIPQALPASKMASAGNDWRTNPATQIRWGLNYISQRYGTPLIAWNKWQERKPHWYDDGGYLQPGLNLAYNGTGRPEPVFTSQQAAGLVRLATAPAGAGGGEFVGDLYLDSGEFLGKVRGEIQQGMNALASSLRAGRKG